VTGAGVTRPLIVLAAGGTGGHMFPAEALAGALAARGHDVALITDRRGQAIALPGIDLAVHRVRAAAMTGASLPAKLTAGLQLLIGAAQSWWLLRRLKPAAVVGFGGYPSVPAVLAAHRLGLPVILHEQNAVLGRANQMLTPYARRIATCFAEVEGVSAADSSVNLLITGGSLGASLFSRVIPKAIGLLPESVRRRLSIVQQARADDLEGVRAAYAALGMTPVLAPFFGDMPARLAAAHLVIGRAGASTVAETAVAGRPAILVPLAIHRDDHQTKNARALEAAGAALVMPEAAFTPEALAARLQPLLALPEKLTAMAAKARDVATLDAAERLADLVLATVPANGNQSNGARRNAA